MDQFKAQLGRTENLADSGNWREIQEVTSQNPVIVTNFNRYMEKPLNYGYSKHGADWGSIEGYGLCSKPGGSPIDVTRDISKYSKQYDIKQDSFTASYTN